MKILNSFIFLFLSVKLFASKVDTNSVYSPSMKKEIKCVVITPDSYKKRNNRYPVVYLLHGYSGNYAQWVKSAPQLKKQADEFQLIIVCPDGGYGSWYLDSPVDSTFKYETFIIKELIPFIDTHYKTKADKAHRAISGLSMGGHGAMYLSIRNKEIFGFAGSICGGVDVRPFPDNWELTKRLGDTTCCKQNWENVSVINIIDNLKNGEVNLIIDCGLGDFFLNVNRALHQKLMRLKIDHDYIERPGKHNKDYWSSAIDYHLLFFKKEFDKN